MLKYLILLFLFLYSIRAETYTSVDQMRKWTHVETLISKLVDDAIKLQENKLTSLQDIKKSLIESTKANNEPDNYEESNEDDSLLHPVKAFSKINKLSNAIENFVILMEENKIDSDGIEAKLMSLDKEYNLPDDYDVSGSGEAILRLQAFYDLSVEDIIKGKLVKVNDTAKVNHNEDFQTLMTFKDCFELGRIAFDNGQFRDSIVWLGKTLVLIEHDMNNPDNSELIIDILDYMSFAAYRIGKIEYSAELTKVWLERDPYNERAIENLAYYEEELTKRNNSSEILDNIDIDDDSNFYHRGIRKTYSEIYDSCKKFDANDYQITEDDTVRSLCKYSSQSISNSRDFCYKVTMIESRFLNNNDIRIEQLHTSPNVIRVYDIITNEEANYLLELAKTRLIRSTVQSRYGSLTTDFRIAKTAWLSNEHDFTIKKIEKRLSDIFQLDLTNSEDLQVVNYGLGGYYGPHLDSARETSFSDKKNGKDAKSKLVDNDRLATILIYLNNVEAGGATVFPRLNLTVEPIERSAVFWYNIKPNGYTDYKTLHSGCPVLLGSKWIATKWPRENENIFRKNIFKFNHKFD